MEDPMPTRNINLTDHLDRFIAAEVGSGRYSNASEVVREGLRLIERRKQEDRAKLKWLRGAVKDGLDEIDRGQGLECSIDELDPHIDQLGKEASAELAAKGKRG
jgi:antitoxin ParD1/3/4